MTSQLSSLLTAFPSLRALVVGDAILDVYLEGSTGRLCREAPVPIVTVADRRHLPGGAANTAVNLATLGARVNLLSLVGVDREGDLLCGALEVYGVGLEDTLRDRTRQTLAKHRVVADGQMLVRFDQGRRQPPDANAEQHLLERLSARFEGSDVIIVSDYDYGVLTPPMIQTLASLQARTPRVLVVDSRRQLEAFRAASPTAIKPNYAEALRLLGQDGPSTPRADAIAAYGRHLLDLTGAQIAAVTLDVEGAIVFERERPPYRTYARPTRHGRAAGAGDTFVAALALALAAGAHTPAAAELASAAAAVVVAKDGTAICSAPELGEYLAAEGKQLATPERLTQRIAFHRQQHHRIVFTNGCFDILHRGHITYLNRAKSLGDVLVVGVNSDRSVRRLKGASRPINSLNDRLQVLSALSCIDYLIPFEDDTPEELLRLVQPDVYVKGGDYTRETLPETALVESMGGRLVFLPYVEDQSTTGIIERIHKANQRQSEPQRARPGLALPARPETTRPMTVTTSGPKADPT